MKTQTDTKMPVWEIIPAKTTITYDETKSPENHADF